MDPNLLKTAQPPSIQVQPHQSPTAQQISPKSKRYSLFVIVGFFILSLFIGGFIFMRQKNNEAIQLQLQKQQDQSAASQSTKQEQGISQSTNTDTSGWGVVSSAVCQVAFSYPPGWMISKGEAKTCLRGLTNPKDTNNSFILIGGREVKDDNPNTLPLANWESVLKAFPYAKPVTVFGEQGLLTKDEAVKKEIYVRKNGFIYSIHYTFNPNDEKERTLYDAILASFQFGEFVPTEFPTPKIFVPSGT